ncbi:MAG TPA: SOS response-associated peptidase [Usitatibacter sp.]|nr:SOS response-associated peptidase [Usitatibacter sp.]
MCSRYFLDADGNVIAYTFRVPADERIRRRYNIAPSQEAPVVRAGQDGAREAAWLRWGLVPYWAKDPSIGSRMINARSETVMEKPAFREAFRSRRCAIPASGFYEWTGDAKHRVPHAITIEGRALLAFAGLWERWKDRDGKRLETYTILTTPANRFVSPMHDRMPAILADDDLEAWLCGSVEDAWRLIRPYPDEPMRERVVSRALNNPRNESPELWALESDTSEKR